MVAKPRPPPHWDQIRANLRSKSVPLVAPAWLWSHTESTRGLPRRAEQSHPSSSSGLIGLLGA